MADVCNAGLMKEGDINQFWDDENDQYRKVELSEIPAGERKSAINIMLLSIEHNLTDLIDKVWVPKLNDPSHGKAPTTQFLKTGGRTSIFLDTNKYKVTLNLKDLGWAEEDTYQEFIPEIKGCGAKMKDAGVSYSSIRTVADEEGKESLAKLVDNLSEVTNDALCMTSRDYLERPLGSQVEAYEIHGLKLSKLEQGRFPIKFTPVLAVTPLPEQVQEQIRLLNKAVKLDEGEELCEYGPEEYAQGIRLTPSTVRALYFDYARTDSKLSELVQRVSTDQDTLEKTAKEMIKDSRRYMEVLTESTKEHPKGYTWSKVGDIHLAWSAEEDPEIWDSEEATEYRNEHDFAWCLAKDMTIAAGTGYWFVDLESLRAGPVQELCEPYDNISAKKDLLRKQGMYMISVLRDHARVNTQFEIGRQSYKRGPVSFREKKEIQEDVLDAMVEEIDKSEDISIQREDHHLQINLKYKHIDGFEFSRKIPLRQLSPIY